MRYLALALALTACGKAPPPTPAPVAAVTAAPVAPRPPAAPEPPSNEAAAYAYLKGETLYECLDLALPAAELAAAGAELTRNGATRLAQPCRTLGQVALGTCVGPGLTRHTMAQTWVDKALAECLKGGGTWTTNRTPAAELAKAQQAVKALETARR
jgi:hypothetical protein